jgi:hypothetical protein
MARRVLWFGIVLVFAASPAWAQRVEISGSAGYTASEGIEVDPASVASGLFDEINPTSGGSFNFTFGFFATERFEIEFLWSRQTGQLEAAGIDKIDITDMNTDNYHANFVYNWGSVDSPIRPFIFGGLGATVYSFEGAFEGGETQFSTTFGGGVKAYFTPNVGIRATGRYTPTYIRSDSEGIWCDPFYCWVIADPHYANQFEISGGITLRF